MPGKINRIIARGVKGIYKDKDIEIGIGMDHRTTFLKVNGKEEPIELIQSIHISMRVNQITTITIEKLKGPD